MKEFWPPILQKDICPSRRPRPIVEGLILTLIVAVLIVQVGCSSNTKPVRLALISTKQLNVNDDGAPLPVIVRVYQLRQKEKFEQASFTALWKGDKELLESDVLERRELTLHPESELTVELEVETKKGAEYIGVLALFRKPDNDAWKKIMSTNISHLPFFTPVVKLVFDQHTVKLKEKE